MTKGDYVPEYLGMSSIAQMYWCHQFFVLKSLRHEDEFRQLADRLAKIPGGIQEFRAEFSGASVRLAPSVLKDTTLDEFKTLLARFGYQPSMENWKAGPREQVLSGTCRHWIEGRHSALFLYAIDAEPQPLTDEQYELWRVDTPVVVLWDDGTIGDLGYESEAHAKGTVSEDSARVETLKAGRLAEDEIAERYDSAQGLFSWKSYRVVGIPDGLTESFAYEFKSSRTNMLRRFQRPVAEAQARLYAYFFKRPAIRVQLHSRESNDVLTIDKPLDVAKTEQDLEDADKLLRGELSPWPPKIWKCRGCEFREGCPIRQE